LGRYEEAEKRYETALSILSRNVGKETDIANTYVNLAHLYEKTEDYEAIEACLDRAKDAIEAPQEQNGYYAYTCRKCAPSFGYFGYFLYEKELNERADRIYAGT
ncbi:MAG: tetratricopeptide repeat protein, partial [Clostridia bacterium]|nr:tetratricopeptide repeat protein [Clostridia bacterium]